MIEMPEASHTATDELAFADDWAGAPGIRLKLLMADIEGARFACASALHRQSHLRLAGGAARAGQARAEDAADRRRDAVSPGARLARTPGQRSKVRRQSRLGRDEDLDDGRAIRRG
jgi:hypothetical protein